MKGVVLLLACIVCSVVAKAQIKVGDQPTVLQKSVALDVQGSNNRQGLWLPRVSDTSITGIRAYNPPDGLVLYHSTSGKLLLRSGGAWTSYITSAVQRIIVGSVNLSGPDVTFTTGTSAGTSNDINIAANSGTGTVTINVPDASATVRGAVTTGTQTFGGTKTFNSGVVVNNGSTLNNGTTANEGLVVSGATGSASNLTLGVTSNTTAASSTDKYLSVNSSGNVTLNSIPVTTNNAIKVKTYTRDLDGLPSNLNTVEVKTFTITILGANFSTTSTVVVSPTVALKLGTKIDWVRVKDANTIELNISTNGTAQPFTSGNGGTFNIAVTEF
jgi:hypothetical protein